MNYKALLTERNYLKSFCANMLNRFGDSIDALAFAWIIYEITGNASWSAVMYGLNLLPTIVLMPFAGVLVERLDKRKVMVVADLGRAVLVALVALLYAGHRLSPWLLACVTCSMSILEAFRIPAGLALFPSIVPREKYTLATSLNQAAGSIFILLGSAAFGPILYFFGVPGAMAVNCAAFALSALFVSRIRAGKPPTAKAGLSARAFITDLGAGLGYMRRRGGVLFICVVGCIVSVFMVPQGALLAPYVQESLGRGECALSLMKIGSVAGLMLGTATFPMVSKRISKSRLFVAGGLAVSVGYFLYILVAQVAGTPVVYGLLVLFSAVIGLGEALLNVVVSVAFMEQIEPDYLSRVGSIFNASASALAPAASFAVAGIATVASVNQIFLVSGIISVILFLFLRKRPGMLALDKTTEDYNDEKLAA